MHTRRTVLQLLGASLAAACRRDPEPKTRPTDPTTPLTPPPTTPTTPTTPTSPPLGTDRTAWYELLRDGLRASPDHHVARADDAVASGDAATILAFVQDTVTPVLDFVEDPVTALRYGARGALRGGAGSPRDVCELLVELLDRAGYPAEVYAGTVTADLSAFGQPKRFQFAPALDEDLLAEVLAAIQPVGGAPTAVDTAGESVALAERIEAALADPGLEAAVLAHPAQGGGREVLPLVRVSTLSGPRWANPLVPGLPLGESGCDGAPVPASPAVETWALDARIELRRGGTNPYDPAETLVAARWNLSDLAGRQVLAGFVPNVPMELRHALTPAEVTAFTPYLGLVGADLPNAEREPFLFADSAVTVGGERIVVDPAGDVRVGGRLVASVPTPPSVTRRIAALAVEVVADGFPAVEGRIVAVDATGEAVVGVTGDAFRLREDGREVAALLEGVPESPPRVALVFDRSGSIPDEFRTAEGLAALAHDLADGVQETFPGAELRVGAPDLAGISWGGEWSDDPDEVERQARELLADASTLWGSLRDAANAAATAIVLVTDGVPTDTLTDACAEAIRRGPPVVTVEVVQGVDPLWDELRALVGGAHVASADPVAAAAAVVGFLGEPDARPVRFAYRARPDGAAVRTVEVEVVETGLVATVDYEVPADPRPSARIAGLNLVLELGGVRVERPLGGWFRHGGDFARDDEDDCEGGLWTADTIAFEGGSLPLAQLLDDLVSARIALQPLLAAAIDGGVDQDEVVALAREAPFLLPNPLVTLCGPLGDGETQVLPGLVRAVRCTGRPRFTTDGLVAIRTTDILPFTRFVDPRPDRREALREGLRRGAELALLEQGLGSRGPLRTLDGQPLVRLSSVYGLPYELPDLTPAVRDRFARAMASWAGFVVLAAPGVRGEVAFFAVDPTTGTVVAVGEDGLGHSLAQQNYCGTSQSISALLAALNLLATFAGATAMAELLFVAKSYVALINLATMHILSLDARGTGIDAACDALGAIVAIGAAETGASTWVLALNVVLQAQSGTADAVSVATGGQTTPPWACSSLAGFTEGAC